MKLSAWSAQINARIVVDSYYGLSQRTSLTAPSYGTLCVVSGKCIGDNHQPHLSTGLDRPPPCTGCGIILPRPGSGGTDAGVGIWALFCRGLAPVWPGTPGS